MLHTTSTHVLLPILTILKRAQDKHFSSALTSKTVQEDGNPQQTFDSRLHFLIIELESGRRTNEFRLLWTEAELKTLASALALVDFLYPEESQTAEAVSVRFIVNDHLGVKNT